MVHQRRQADDQRPFRLQGLTEGERLVLERNSYYYRDETEDPLDESVIPYRLVCIYQEGSAGRSLAGRRDGADAGAVSIQPL